MISGLDGCWEDLESALRARRSDLEAFLEDVTHGSISFLGESFQYRLAVPHELTLGLEEKPSSDVLSALIEAIDSRHRLLRVGVRDVYECFERDLS